MLLTSIDWLKPDARIRMRSLIVVLLAFVLAACAGKEAKPVVTVVKPVVSAGKPMLTPEEQAAWAAALAMLQNGDVKAAESAFQSLLTRQPRLAGAYVNLGILAERSQDIEQARTHYQKALEINPANDAALVQLALLDQAQGKFRDAESGLLKAESVNASSEKVQYNLGVLYELYLQNPELALKHYRRFVELSKSEDKALVERWILLLERRT